jgi:hypothetical protein
MPRPRHILATLAGLALTASCTVSAVLDDSRLQEEIQRGFQEQTGATVQNVDCPDDQPLTQGATFECTLTTADGETVGIRVTQTDAQGNIRWELVQE